LFETAAKMKVTAFLSTFLIIISFSIQLSSCYSVNFKANEFLDEPVDEPETKKDEENRLCIHTECHDHGPDGCPRNYETVSWHYCRGIFGKYEYCCATPEEPGTADAFLDTILAAVKQQFADKLDPFNLPDKELSFEQKVVVVNFKGHIKLFEGVMNGLSSLHRTKASHIVQEEGSEDLGLQLRIGVNDLDFRYRAHIAFMGIGPTVTIKGKLKHLDIYAEGGLLSDSAKPFITEFDIKELDGLNIEVEGLSVLDFVINIIAKGVTTIFKSQVTGSINNVLKSMIEEVMSNFSLDNLGNMGDIMGGSY